MLKRISNWLVLSLLTVTLIVGCSLVSSKPSNEPDNSSAQLSMLNCRTVEHSLRATEVCGQPETVVALSAHALDLLLSLGVQPAAYAPNLSIYRGERFDNPAQQIPFLGTRVTNKPINLGRSGEPSLEKLTALNPDLIIGEGTDNYELLSQIAPTLVFQDRGTPGQWQKHLRFLANALNRQKNADAVIEQYDTRIAEARTDLANAVAAHPKLLLLVAHRLEEGFYVADPNNYLSELLIGIGFQLMPQFSDIKPNTLLSIEFLPKLNDTDSIIVLGYDRNIDYQDEKTSSQFSRESATEQIDKNQTRPIQQSWEASAIAQSLTASQENRVYFTTYYKWGGLVGPIGFELVLEELREFLLGD